MAAVLDHSLDHFGSLWITHKTIFLVIFGHGRSLDHLDHRFFTFFLFGVKSCPACPIF